jgi:hypothetical protein
MVAKCLFTLIAKSKEWEKIIHQSGKLVFWSCNKKPRIKEKERNKK